MAKSTLTLILFACFAFGLPIWAMQTNEYNSPPVHACIGECYSNGSQSALMWSQSSQLSQADIENLAAYTSGL